MVSAVLDRLTLPAAPVLITGATGFLGRPLAARLRAAGLEPVTLSRAAGGAHTVCDLTDRAAVRGLVSTLRPATVYHLAAQVTARQDPALALPMFDANLAATVNLLDALREAGGARLVLVGSVEEGSSSPYGLSKLCAGLYARYYAAQGGLSLVECRLHLGYGPGQDPAKLIPYLIRGLLHGPAPTLRSAVRRCQFVYLDDIVEALVAAADPALAGATVEIGAPPAIPLGELARLLESLIANGATVAFGEPDRQEEPEPPPALPRPAAWTWQPRVPLAEGLRRTVAALGASR